MYQAIWAPTSDFSEVLISRKMLHDHSPYVVLDALNKVMLISLCWSALKKSCTFVHQTVIILVDFFYLYKYVCSSILLELKFIQKDK